MSEKDISTEGTRARAQDRGAPQGLEFFEQALDPDKRVLGNPEDVLDIMREFAAEVHTIRVASTAQDADPDQFYEALVSLCRRYGDIFLGKNPDYTAGTFNSPEGVGTFLKVHYSMEGEADAAPALFLQHIANQVMEAEVGYLTDDLTEETAQFHLEAALDEAVTGLLGLPPSAEDDDYLD